jgi:hypothetical protein
MVITPGSWTPHHYSAICYGLFHLAVVRDNAANKSRARISMAHLSKSNPYWHGLVR